MIKNYTSTILAKSKKLKKYNIPFDDLFKSKESAVICYLSLERRFLDLGKRYRELSTSIENKTFLL